MAEKIILLGCGGHAKSVVDAIEEAGKYSIAGFVDKKASNFYYRNYKVVGCDDDLAELFHQGIKNAFICIGYLGNGHTRDRLYGKLSQIGFMLPTIVSPSSAIATDAEIENGVFVGKNAVINANSHIGPNAIINSGAIVEHDCVVGAFSHVAVGAILCGNVKIGKNCLIGAGSIVLQGINIGDYVIIGAGSTVLNNVGSNIVLYNKKVKFIYKNQTGGGGDNCFYNKNLLRSFSLCA